MRNHTKPEKEKTKSTKQESSGTKLSTAQINSKGLKKSPSDSNTALAKKLKEKSMDSQQHDIPESFDNQQSIFLDAGSKKSYMDLTSSKNEAEPYPRISVIRSVCSQSSNYEQCQFGYYQEKPVDFSPKNKFKSECSNNLIEISRQYATMVV